MNSPSELQAKDLQSLVYYAFGSVVLAGLYWAAILIIDRLPCSGFLCNLEWVMAFFGPILLIAIVAPLINWGLLRWEREKPRPVQPMARLFFSAIGTGFSVLLVAVCVYDLSRRGFANVDLSPQSLILITLFVGLTWFNLHCVRILIERRAGEPSRPAFDESRRS